MWNLITSYLIQSGECVLPGIGTFTTFSSPASLDVANKEILPPETEFRFTDKTGQPAEGLIKYVARKKEIDSDEALRQVKEVCGKMKEKLFSGEKVLLNSIGVLYVDQYQNIAFEKELFSPIIEPVPAIRVVHKEAKHPLVVGDKETDSSEMNEYLNSEPEFKSANNFWKIAAMILFLIGAGLLFFHFYNNTSANPLGNGTKVIPAPTSKTYISK